MVLTLAAVLAWPAAAAPPWLGTGRVHGFVVETQGRPVLGAADAVATIEEFGAFTSAPCAALAAPLRRLLEERQGAVKLIFRHLPGGGGPDGRVAAEIAEEAFAQGHFWEFHEAAFARAGKLRSDDAFRVASLVGLDMARLRRALDSGLHRVAVAADERLARRRGLRAVAPVLLVGGRVVAGALGYDLLASAVDREVARARSATLAGAAPRVAQQARPARRVALRTIGAPSRGSEAARVVLVEFADLARRDRGHVASMIVQLRHDFPDGVRHAFKHAPAAAESMAVHEIAAEAHRQGRFWELYDRLALGVLPAVGGAESRTRTAERLAQAAGLDLAAVKAALGAGLHRSAIEQDAREAARLGVRDGAIFVDGQKIEAPPTYQLLREAVEVALRGGLLQALPR
ncbi:MAG: thioredoxin domain-containing protein [Myxococcota bacterium]